MNSANPVPSGEQVVERAFHARMLQIYVAAKEEAGYNATRFLAMVNEYGGLEAAKMLLHATTVSDGYTALWERGRLDLTVEAVILGEEWVTLFSETEKEIAATRLRQYGYTDE